MGLEGFLERSIRIRREEVPKVALFCSYLFLVAFSTVLGRTVGDTFFLSRNDPANLPYLYLGIAASIAASGLLYARYADRYRRDRLILACTAGFLLSLLFAWALLHLQTPGINPGFYIWAEVYGTLLAVQFWTFANDLLDLREAKRMFSLFALSGLAGTALGGFLIRSWAGPLGTENLLFMAALALLGVLGVVSSLARRHGEILSRVSKSRPWPGPALPGTQGVRRSRYLRLVLALIALTAIVTTVVDYQFKVVMAQQYSDAALATFFGGFYSAASGGALVLEFFLVRRIVGRFGMLFALTLLPVSLACGSFAILVRPTFWSAVLTRFAGSDFLAGANNNATHRLFQPLPLKARGRLKALADAAVRPGASGLGALLILFLSPLMGLGELSLIALPCVAGWIWCAVAVRREFVLTLYAGLKRRRLDLVDSYLNVSDGEAMGVLASALENPDPETVRYAMATLAGVANFPLLPHLIRLAGHPEAKVRAEALRLLGERGEGEALSAVTLCLKDPEPGVRAAAVRALGKLKGRDALGDLSSFLQAPEAPVRMAAILSLIQEGGLDGILASAEALRGLLEGPDPEARRMGARLLGELGVHHFHQPLLRMLRDPDLTVRLEAIQAASQVRHPALLEPLIDSLSDPKTRAQATGALAGFGESGRARLGEILGALDRPPPSRKAAARALERMGGEEAERALEGQLLDEDPGVRSEVVGALSRLARRSGKRGEPGPPLWAILRELEDHRRLTLLQATAEGVSGGGLLSRSLSERRAEALERVFHLLALLHPPERLLLIRQNLAGEDPKGRAQALELLEGLLNPEIKKGLLPVLERPSLAVQVRLLREGLSLEPPRLEEALREILGGKDGWLRTVALFTVGAMQLPEFVPSLAEAMKDSDPLVRETAVFALGKLKSPEARGHLAMAAEDPDASLRALARRVLSEAAA